MLRIVNMSWWVSDVFRDQIVWNSAHSARNIVPYLPDPIATKTPNDKSQKTVSWGNLFFNVAPGQQRIPNWRSREYLIGALDNSVTMRRRQQTY